MSAIEVFQFRPADQQIRTLILSGRPWFVAADVCAVLGYGGGARNAVSRLPDRMKDVAEVNTPGGAQQMTVVNEAGVYRLVMRSNMPAAEQFQDWISEEVLPAIRKTGRYDPGAPQLPQSYAAALRELANEVERREYAERELADAAPKAEAWQVLASAEGDYSVRDAAYILNRDPAIDTGQKRLFALLREWKLIGPGDRPYAEHARHVRLRAGSRPDKWSGEEIPTTQVRITVEGLRYLHRRMGGAGQLRFIMPSQAVA